MLRLGRNVKNLSQSYFFGCSCGGCSNGCSGGSTCAFKADGFPIALVLYHWLTNEFGIDHEAVLRGWTVCSYYLAGKIVI